MKKKKGDQTRHHKNRHRGVLARLKAMMTQDRLGDLLVINGELTQAQLQLALVRQTAERGQLGRILVQERMLSRRALYRTLLQQASVRCLAAAVTVFIGLSAFGMKPARAGETIPNSPIRAEQTIQPQPRKIVYAPMDHYPALFGSEERASYNLEPFTKWTGMFNRFERSMQQAAGQQIMRDWQHSLDSLRGLPLTEMAAGVNDLVNAERYITDNRNWGQTDYWATPIEFFTRGGDCEDFAIAKYVSLRALGVPDERLRVAIVQDMQKNIPHAVLIVYTEEGPMLLDNQIKTMKTVAGVNHYKPIFSINRQAWWLHSKPQAPVTVIASASQ